MRSLPAELFPGPPPHTGASCLSAGREAAAPGLVQAEHRLKCEMETDEDMVISLCTCVCLSDADVHKTIYM
jgi:hypothetical protein